jgi:hypothetical protein
MKFVVCLISLAVVVCAGGCASTPAVVPTIGGPCVYSPFMGKTNEDFAKYVLALRDTIRQCESDRRANESNSTGS